MKLKKIQIENLSVDERKSILEIWNEEFPAHMSYQELNDLDEYLNKLQNAQCTLLLSDSDNVSGCLLVFTRENERWFMILINKSSQGQGIGKEVMLEAMKQENDLCGWVVDHDNDHKESGERYESPLGFYKKLGFRIEHEIRLEKNELSCVKIVWNRRSE